MGSASLKLLRNQVIVTVHADTHTCELQHSSDSRSIPGRSRKQQGAFPLSLLSALLGWPNTTCPSALYKSPKFIKGHCYLQCSVITPNRNSSRSCQTEANCTSPSCFLSSLNCLARWGRMGHKYCQLTDSQDKVLKVLWMWYCSEKGFILHLLLENLQKPLQQTSFTLKWWSKGILH